MGALAWIILAIFSSFMFIRSIIRNRAKQQAISKELDRRHERARPVFRRIIEERKRGQAVLR